MDSISSKRTEAVIFQFSDLVSDRATLLDPWEVYLGVVGNFAVISNHGTVLSEQMFTVVELAIELLLWAQYDKERWIDFIFRSMETEEIGLLSIRAQNKNCGMWIVTSTTTIESCHVADLEMVSAILDFYNRLKAAVLDSFSINIDRVLEWRRADSRGTAPSLRIPRHGPEKH